MNKFRSDLVINESPLYELAFCISNDNSSSHAVKNSHHLFLSHENFGEWVSGATWTTECALPLFRFSYSSKPVVDKSRHKVRSV